MAKKQGFNLKGMTFDIGGAHYLIGDLYGVFVKGKGRVNKNILFKNGENLGLYDVDKLIEGFNIKI